MMNSIIAIFIIFISVVNADHHEGHHSYKLKSHSDLLAFRDHCVSTLSIPADLVEKYKKWEYPDDEKTHCYMKCIFEKFEFFDEEKGFDVHKIHHQLAGEDGAAAVDHNDDMHQKIEQCADKNTQGSDACSWAYRVGMCFVRENLHLQGSKVLRKN